jgi:cyclic pyranopterin phosphate synthase
MTDPPGNGGSGDLTHLDASGAARMVDVSGKPATRRHARAEARVRMSPGTAATVLAGDAPKGDVIGTARLAGIQAAKRTWDLIPLAHQLPLSHVDVAVEVDGESGEARIEAAAATTAGTGVEMEAMTACSVAALTLYDMVKGIERGVVIDGLRLLEKSGGKHDWRAE